MRLEEVLDTLDHTEVVIRGAAMRVRALLALESEAIDAQVPEPRKRMKANPQGPRLAEVVDEHNAEYLREKKVADTLHIAVRVAVGLDIEGPDGKWRPDMDSVQAKRLAEHVLRFFTWSELLRIVQAQSGIVSPGPESDADRIGSENAAGN